MDIKRTLSYLLGLLATTLATMRENVPPGVQKAFGVLLWLVLVDMLTGLVRSAFAGKVRSENLRRKSYAKLTQYFGLISLGLAVVAFSGEWAWAWAPLGIACLTEVLSITENILGLQSYGVKLGAAEPFLNAVRRMFEVCSNQVSTVNDLPAPAPEGNQPMIAAPA